MADLKKIDDTAVYTLAAADKMMGIAVSGIFNAVRVQCEGSTDGGRTYPLVLGPRVPPSGNPVFGPLDLVTNQGFGLDLTTPAGLTNVRVHDVHHGGGTATVTFFPQPWPLVGPGGSTTNTSFGDPSNVEGVIVKQLLSTVSVSGDSGPQNTGKYPRLHVGVNVTSGSGTLDFYVDTLGADGVWYNVYHFTQFTSTGQATRTIGDDMETSVTFNNIVRLRWVVGSGTWIFSASVTGRP